MIHNDLMVLTLGGLETFSRVKSTDSSFSVRNTFVGVSLEEKHAHTDTTMF